MTARLEVRPRDRMGDRDWPWVLADADTGEVWGDYPTEGDARMALAQALDHGEGTAAGPGAACWEYQAGELPIRLSLASRCSEMADPERLACDEPGCTDAATAGPDGTWCFVHSPDATPAERLANLWSDERCSWTLEYEPAWYSSKATFRLDLQWETDRGPHHADWVTYTWQFYADTADAAITDAVTFCEGLLPFEECHECDGCGCEECDGTGLANREPLDVGP